jgi:hypothetical protein
MNELSVLTRNGAWLEHNDESECRSQQGNKVSQSKDMKAQSIVSMIGCSRSLLQVKCSLSVEVDSRTGRMALSVLDCLVS